VGQLKWEQGDVICLDSNAIIYAVERIEPYHSLLLPLWAAATVDTVRLIGSELLLLETLVKPLREKDDFLERTIRHFLTDSDIELQAITRPILEQAAFLRATLGMRTPDSIHGATAYSTHCTRFITNDKGFLRFTSVPITILSNVVND
jgi:predicted nucleic acid-binding protein